MQEVASEASRAPGRIPQTIECELTNDLVNSAIPGDVVVMSGVVKLMIDENSMLEYSDGCEIDHFLYRWITEDIRSIITSSVY